MLFSFFGRNIPFTPVAVKNDTYFITIIDRGKTEYGPDLGDDIPLPGMTGAEKGTGADIDQQHNGELPFFFKNFAERMPETGRDIPVNKTDIVAGCIFPDLFKRHAFPLESTVVLTREQVTGEFFAFDLKLPDLF